MAKKWADTNSQLDIPDSSWFWVSAPLYPYSVDRNPHCPTTNGGFYQLRLHPGTLNHLKSSKMVAGFPTALHNWWLTYPSEKWWSSSVGMMTFPIYGKINHVPNHQSASKQRLCFQTCIRPYIYILWQYTYTIAWPTSLKLHWIIPQVARSWYLHCYTHKISHRTKRKCNFH